ncbi:MAG: hypothetical protein GF350_16665 [Chitinivibrionales bacterium]|nr:hypothetical protein [Chitinivibrionales bacterium]
MNIYSKETKKKNCIVSCIILLMIAIISHGATMIEFYVSPSGDDAGNGLSEQTPFRTLERAQQAVRENNTSMTGDIIVNLLPGRLWLDSMVRFTEADGGTGEHKIIYKAVSPKTVSICGGKQITGWTQVNAEKNIWKAPTAGMGFDPKGFRQLYVNGKRTIRSRHPNITPRSEKDLFLGDRTTDYYYLTEWNRTNQTIKVPAADLNGYSSWNPLQNVEVIAQRVWGLATMRVENISVSGSFGYIYVQQPERDICFNATFPPKNSGSRYHFENCIQFIDAEREWYFNDYNGDLFYKPRSGEDMNTAIVIAPLLTTLVLIEPTGASFSEKADHPVLNLEFHGIIFEYSTWMKPSHEGNLDMQAGMFSWVVNISPYFQFLDRPPAAVRAYATDNIRFESNVFRHMGATGLDIYSGNTNATVIGNTVYDITGNGMMFGEHKDSLSYKCNSYVVEDMRRIPHNIMVSNNYLSRCGQQQYGCVGIGAGFNKRLTLYHNEIRDMPYTGISVGWCWEPMDMPICSTTIRGNLVDSVMMFQNDGGAIYTLGNQPASIIDSNYIDHMFKYSPTVSRMFNIYLDEGSSNLLVQHNKLGTNLSTTEPIETNVPGPGIVTGNNGNTVDNVVRQNAGLLPEYASAAILPPDNGMVSPVINNYRPVESFGDIAHIGPMKNGLLHCAIHSSGSHSVSLMRPDGAVVSNYSGRGRAVYELNLESLSQGMYLIRVVSDNASEIKRTFIIR